MDSHSMSWSKSPEVWSRRVFISTISKIIVTKHHSNHDGSLTKVDDHYVAWCTLAAGNSVGFHFRLRRLLVLNYLITVSWSLNSALLFLVTGLPCCSKWSPRDLISEKVHKSSIKQVGIVFCVSVTWNIWQLNNHGMTASSVLRVLGTPDLLEMIFSHLQPDSVKTVRLVSR